MSAPARKNTATPLILSVVFPGLGQIYYKRTQRGGVLALLGAICLLGAAVTLNFARNTSIAIYILIWLSGLYDTYETYKKVKQGIE